MNPYESLGFNIDSMTLVKNLTLFYVKRLQRYWQYTA